MAAASFLESLPYLVSGSACVASAVVYHLDAIFGLIDLILDILQVVVFVGVITTVWFPNFLEIRIL